MRLSTILVMPLAAMTSAHMELIQPPSLRQRNNPFTTSADTDLKSPMSYSGSNYPCRGHLSVLNSPQGQSTASWPAGSRQTWTLEGSTRHEGGSCQASISKDGGTTFKVVHSYIGGCPLKDSWDFKVPGDTPPGPALFAYSWHNRIGNREMYMNCASVTITGGGGRESIPFNRRPNILRAHAGTDCNIAEGFDVEYPDPGPDVTRFPQTKLIAPVGSACGTSNPGGGGGGGGIGGGFGSVSPNNPNGGGPFADGPAVPVPISQFEIGRASCRERVF